MEIIVLIVLIVHLVYVVGLSFDGETTPVSGTNSEAERTLRGAAMDRKTGRANKTSRGARCRTVIGSVLESLRRYLPEFTLPLIVKEVLTWQALGRSCFARQLAKLENVPGDRSAATPTVPRYWTRFSPFRPIEPSLPRPVGVASMTRLLERVLDTFSSRMTLDAARHSLSDEATAYPSTPRACLPPRASLVARGALLSFTMPHSWPICISTPRHAFTTREPRHRRLQCASTSRPIRQPYVAYARPLRASHRMRQLLRGPNKTHDMF